MCGIYGAYAFTEKGKVEIQKYKEKLIKTSKLRGGDGHGHFDFENGYLGVSRAQPLPEISNIPLPISNDRFVMSFNGTLSNDRELNEEYNFIPNRNFVDTEIALKLWNEKNWKACNEMVGGFAFIVYDKLKKTLTIAKNFKTLWYIKTTDFMIFASEKEFLFTKQNPFLLEYPNRFPQNSVLILDSKGISYETIKRLYWSHTPDLNNKAAVIVTSGGIDSITSAYIARRIHKKQITLIHFDYGQRASKKEWEAVKYVAGDLKCECFLVDLTLLGSWGKSPLTDRAIPLPLGMKSVESTLCWTPGRNMLMISYAAAYAESIGSKWLYYGNNLEEEATGYSDNDLEFIYIFNDLLDYGTLKGVKIKRALARLMKPEILVLGNYLKVPFEKTWSCDEGGKFPCGICGCCTTRRHAFLRAGLPDEQRYLEKLQDNYPWKKPIVYDLNKILNRIEKD